MSELVIANKSELVDVADAIRSKTGKTAGMSLSEMPSAISGIDGTVTPTISVSSSGLITATAGKKSVTKQLDIQGAKTVTPSTSSQTVVESGRYTTGAVTVSAVSTQTKTVTPSTSTQNITPDSNKFLSKVIVNGDANLIPENIKSGMSIFGVDGSYEGSVSDVEVIYFIVQNNLPVALLVNGMVCYPDEGTLVPFIKDCIVNFAIVFEFDGSYSIEPQFVEMIEGEDGEFYPEESDGGSLYTVDESMNSVFGVLYSFYPNNQAQIADNTITFNAVY